MRRRRMSRRRKTRHRRQKLVYRSLVPGSDALCMPRAWCGSICHFAEAWLPRCFPGGRPLAVPSCIVDRAGTRWQDIDGYLAMHHFSLRTVPWRALGCLRAPLVRGQSLRDGRLPKGLVDGLWVVIYFAGKQGCGCCEFSVVDDAIRASLRMMRTCIL